MTFECKKLRDAARGQSCVRCGKTENVVGCHYTGVRRLSFGGGFGIKVHDFLIADLCQECHHYMDTLSRKKDGTSEYLHSEEFLYLIALTWERRVVHQGLFLVGGNRAQTNRLLLAADTHVAAEEVLRDPVRAGTDSKGDPTRIGSETAEGGAP
jgi:hypothetical protein